MIFIANNIFYCKWYRELFFALLILGMWPWCPFLIMILCIAFAGVKTPLNSKFLFLFTGFIIAISFGLLAFTQKSTATEGTDIERYYYFFSDIENLSFSYISILLNHELLTYFFSLVNILTVMGTKNVQFISLIWTVFIYLTSFCAIYNFIQTKDGTIIHQPLLRFSLIIFIVFGVILFVQVTETIKSAAAITFLFYILSLNMCGLKLWKSVILLIICIGIHAQTLMLLPILFYKYYNYKYLVIICIITMIAAPFFNILKPIADVISHFGDWGAMLFERTVGYGDDMGNNSSKRYIFILCLIMITCIYLHKKNVLNKSLSNIILSYITISFLFFNVSDAFIRFANFSSIIAAIEFGAMLKTNGHCLKYLYFSIFIMLNLQLTIGRTIGGGYTSSYMDNSIEKIMLSSSIQFLNYRAYP